MRRTSAALCAGFLLWACNTAKPEGSVVAPASVQPVVATSGTQPSSAQQAAASTPSSAPSAVSAAALASALGATPPSSAANSAGPGTGTAASPGISGPVVAGEGFAVHLEAQGAPTLGKASSVKVVLNAKAPFHCNDKYPYKFTPTANPSLTFSEAVARGMNIAPTEATMDVSFTPTQAGALTVSGELSFSVCTDDRCLVEKQALSVVVNVKGAS